MSRTKVETEHAILVEPSQLFCKITINGVNYKCKHYSNSYMTCGVTGYIVNDDCQVTDSCPLKWQAFFPKTNNRISCDEL